MIKKRPGMKKTMIGGMNKMEEALRPASEKFRNTLRAEFTAKSLVEALQTYKLEAIAALKVIRAEMGV
jgi:hypothetical protein